MINYFRQISGNKTKKVGIIFKKIENFTTKQK